MARFLEAPGARVRERLRRERRNRSRSSAWNAVLWTFALGGPAAVLAVLHSRLTDPARGAALDRFGVAWGVMLFSSVALAALAWFLARGSESALAQDLDRRHRSEGLFSSAAALLSGGVGGGLAPLVLARADGLVATLPPSRRVHAAGFKIRRTALFLLLSLILALIPGGPQGVAAGLGGGDGGGDRGPASAESREAGGESPESRANPPMMLDELMSLNLRSDHRIYALGSEIFLTIEVVTKRPIATDVPLAITLAVTDGLPSPDVGFGPGFRPVPLRLEWTVPKEEGASIKQIFPMRETLRALGIYKPGLFTCDAFALPALEGMGVADGARSNELTFQVTENKEDLQTKTPQSQGQEKRPETKTPDETTDQRGKGGGRKKPELGDPDRLPDATRVAALVEPIVNAGPTIEKDVAVYEREPGGPAPPLPVRRRPPDDSSGRTFLKRPESPVTPPALSVEERDVLRRYFDALRGQKKL